MQPPLSGGPAAAWKHRSPYLRPATLSGLHGCRSNCVAVGRVALCARDEAYDRVAKQARVYADYPKQTDRHIPVIRLRPHRELALARRRNVLVEPEHVVRVVTLLEGLEPGELGRAEG